MVPRDVWLLPARGEMGGELAYVCVCVCLATPSSGMDSGVTARIVVPE